MTSIKRRFIAGATCPKCESIDTLFLSADALNGAFECAACGYREEPPEPKTQAAEQTEVQTVKFIDATNTNEH